MINKIKAMPKVYFVFIDAVDNLKKQEFESWYKTLFNGTRGTWIGNGLGTQFTLKSTLSTRALSLKLLLMLVMKKNMKHYKTVKII